MKTKTPPPAARAAAPALDNLPATFRRVVKLEARAADDSDSRKVAVSFSSEAAIRDFYEPIILLHEKNAADLEPLRSTGAVLSNHNPDRIIGRPENVRLDLASRKGRATIVFDDDEDGNRALQKVKSGSLRGVSVAYELIEAQRIGDGESWRSPEGRDFRGPVVVATRWRAREFSLTPIPADADVGVNRGQRKEHAMPKRSTTPAGTAAPTSDPLDDGDDFLPFPEAPPSNVDAAAERRRAREIIDLCRRAGLAADRVDTLIASGATVEAARAEAFQHLIAQNPPARIPGHVDVVGDTTGRFQRDAQAALLSRIGCLRDSHKDLANAEPLRLPLGELARRALVAEGHPAHDWPMALVAQRALTHGSTAFPALLENVAEKALAVGFSEAAVTWRTWCRRGSLSRLGVAATRVSISDAPSLELVPELMPISEGQVSDGKESLTLQTYGRSFGVSRQALINDDLNALEMLPQMFGAAAARRIEDLVFTRFQAADTMRDGNPLFDAAHVNLASAAAMDLESIAELIALLRKQTAPGGSFIDVVPKFLLVPVALELAASQILTATVNAAEASNAIPASIRSLQLVVSPRLTSATAHYLIADPAAMPTIEVGLLDGNETPAIVRVEGSRILGVEWICYIDVAVGALTWHGAAKNPGA